MWVVVHVKIAETPSVLSQISSLISELKTQETYQHVQKVSARCQALAIGETLQARDPPLTEPWNSRSSVRLENPY